MAEYEAIVDELDSVAWNRLQDCVERFERAWANDLTPDIGSFLPAEFSDRLATLVELIHTDIEYRTKRGMTARVEDYLRQFPELLSQRPLVGRLIASEFGMRSKCEAELSIEEYWERFPEYRDELTTHLKNNPAMNSQVRARQSQSLGSSEGQQLDASREITGSIDRVMVRPRDNDLDSSPPPIPKKISRYRVMRILGEGQFGRVFLAYDDDLDRPVAIKVPLIQRMARPEDIEAFLTEARILASLHHPHIVTVFDVGRTEDGVCFVVSKYIDGTDLERMIKNSCLSAAESARLAMTVAQALHYAHRHGLTHRDVKPANILIDGEGAPILADFGLALKDSDFGKASGMAGTPLYMSPEQAKGEGHRVDGRSDIFSLGVVLYELLTKKRPFQAINLDELLARITADAPKPPRQIDDAIPKEVERICLKALSKRATDRYATAKDMADDLDQFLVEHSSPQRLAGSDRINAASPSAPMAPVLSTRSPESASQTITIVPKGLRSFDAHDASFFLKLLPGPCDRDGLPDSVRFWKTRIEDRDGAFSVGLIYGPSGCGKSSMVKAGLLPHLSETIVPIYIEATADETESRLLNSLLKRCSGLAANLPLKDILAAIRRGEAGFEGKKVLIVLDQFEQWLHAKKEQANTELVSALRQCEGGRLQAIVMVRDDFWLAVSRFMRELEVPVVEGQNSALVDLFDMHHAKKVLKAFGRAFDRLPEAPGAITKEQDKFLEQAVSDLAQDGKVISVRLSLFAEMMKGKPWTLASLKTVGGMEGVGITFLDETFSATTAPPEHRLHQKAARAVLKSLLPESGADIKGHMRSREVLLEESGYAARPKDFEALLRILDGEVRLLTPTDPEGKTHDESSAPALHGSQYFQLTHDYLVPALRDWLTRKQKETRRGRAELLLADRAAMWNVRRENRQLPSFWQWLTIRWSVPTRVWTPPQQTMMRIAAMRFVFGGGILAVCIAILVASGLAVRAKVVDRERQSAAEALVEQALVANIAELPEIVHAMASQRERVDPLLLAAFAKAEPSSQRRLQAALALAPVDDGVVDELLHRLLDSEPNQAMMIRDQLAAKKSAITARLWSTATDAAPSNVHRRLRAAAALAAYDPVNDQWRNIAPTIVADLVASNPIHFGTWTEAFRNVKTTLVPPLTAIFRDRSSNRSSERSLATSLLADYAAGDCAALAELVLEADATQFRVAFSLLQAHGDRASPLLRAELDKAPVAPAELKDEVIMKKDDIVTAADSRFKDMAYRRYEIALEQGKNYRIEMRSQIIDSYLVLLDQTGVVLKEDDDSGDGKDSRIKFTPKVSGAYVIYAGALKSGVRRPFGPFTLTVSISPAPSGPPNSMDLPRRQANAAVALLLLGQAEPVWPRLKHAPDPTARSYLVRALGSLGADPRQLIERFPNEPDLSARRAIILSLSLRDAPRTFNETLRKIYVSEPDPGLRAAAEWFLRQSGENGWLKSADIELAKSRDKRLDNIVSDIAAAKADRRWYVNRQGQTMIVIPGPIAFRTGEVRREVGVQQLTRTIPRTFAIASKPVTVAEYLRCHPNCDYSEKISPEPDCPISYVNWHEAANYCNWLSRQEGIPEDQWCFETDSRNEVVRLRTNYLNLTGYRLPTAAELEYATRADSITPRYFGSPNDLLGQYAWYGANSNRHTWPVGTKRPNDFGFFDVHGNIWNWTMAGFLDDPAREIDIDDRSAVQRTERKNLRGGCYGTDAVNVNSSNAYGCVMTDRQIINGFRVSRTIAP